jgi:hypothetical protein
MKVGDIVFVKSEALHGKAKVIMRYSGSWARDSSQYRLSSASHLRTLFYSELRRLVSIIINRTHFDLPTYYLTSYIINITQAEELTCQAN